MRHGPRDYHATTDTGGFMLVTVEINRFGHLEIEPVSYRLSRKYRRHLAAMGVKARRSDALVYIQSDTDTALADFVPARKRADVRAGWTVRVRVDPYLFGNYVGYDAAECV